MHRDPGTSAVDELLRVRRTRLERLLGRPLAAPRYAALPAERRTFLREEGEALYWNELAWDKLTPETERLEQPVELAFPGLLAFVDGLMIHQVAREPGVPGGPRAEVVDDLLGFLAARCVQLEASGSPADAKDRAITERLLDLVLSRFHGLADEELEMLEIARLRGDE